MNWKLIGLGGLAWYIATFVIGLVTVEVIHMGIMRPTYKGIPHFFRPELMQEPPATDPLLMYWIITGLIASFLTAFVFGWVRPAFSGPGWRQGLSFGVALTVATCAVFLVYSGVLDLPAKVWLWWNIDNLILFCAGGAAMGAVAGRFAPPAQA